MERHCVLVVIPVLIDSSTQFSPFFRVTISIGMITLRLIIKKILFLLIFLFCEAAVFGSTGTVSHHYNDFSIHEFKGSAGAGLRYLLFPKKDIYVRMDYAATREGNGFYIYIGEAF